MTALVSALAEIRTGAADRTTAGLLAEECAALVGYLGRLRDAVLAAEDRPEGWSVLIADAAAEIRELEKP